MPRKVVHPILRFWKFVDRSGNCWLWTGAANSRGYGTIGVNHRAVRVNRFIWEQSFGPIPNGFGVGHYCNNPRCVRPAHLYLTTNGDNNRFRHANGRDRNPFFRFQPHIPRLPRKTLRERFESKVLVNDGCWLWNGSKNQDGYGLIWDGQPEGAHRVSWRLYHGSIPSELAVLHNCHNAQCVNPTHLHLGTQAQNNGEREAAGRGNQQRGERHGRAKLTAEQVHLIRYLHKTGVAGHRKLAKQFNVSSGTVWSILSRQNWAWL